MGHEALLTTPVTAPRGTTPQDQGPREEVTNGVRRVLSNLSLHHARSEEELPPQHHDLPQAAVSSTQTHDQFVRLPKFELPTFVGEIDKFPPFWDAYNSAIHANSALPPVVKFHHLKSLLKGEALAVVAGYDLTAENYEYAVRTLRDTYYRPQLIRMQLSTRLQQMKPANTSALHQRTTLAQIKSLWLQLQKHGDHEDNIYVMRFIRQKFPQRTLEHLGNLETADPVPWKVPQLLDGLDRAIRMFEVIADTADHPPVHMQTLAV
ncbi:hypothetical protein TELCIR_22113 [Teladorsagia circumcincta]|uniref:Peptidase family A16 n=1 Tax=Teladorsagia circumcincta TaxID=45464 RepID=A0A2G9TEV6_TELCI|nr:hypothetical protein TELCIR_22113 [Teladorsagia circumcincta]